MCKSYLPLQNGGKIFQLYAFILTSASPDSLNDNLIKLCGLEDAGPAGLPA